MRHREELSRAPSSNGRVAAASPPVTSACHELVTASTRRMLTGDLGLELPVPTPSSATPTRPIRPPAPAIVRCDGRNGQPPEEDDMSTEPTTTTPRRTPTITSATRATALPSPSGLWILTVLWKTRAIRSASLLRRTKRVSHNTLDAADGAHSNHRQYRPCLYTRSRVGYRQPVANRWERTERRTSLRSDERSTSPKSVIHIPGIARNTQARWCCAGSRPECSKPPTASGA